jgi:hypothetical protein
MAEPLFKTWDPPETVAERRAAEAAPSYPESARFDWRGCLALDAPQQPAAIEVELRRALRRLPGTKAVRDFAFGRAGDVLTVGLTAVPFEGAPLPLGRVLHA